MPQTWHYWTLSWQEQDIWSSRQHHMWTQEHIYWNQGETKAQERRPEQGRNVVLLSIRQKVGFLNKRTNVLWKPQKLTSHPVGFDKPNSDPLLTIHNQSHLSSGPQLINQLKTHTKPQCCNQSIQPLWRVGIESQAGTIGAAPKMLLAFSGNSWECMEWNQEQ